MPNMGEYAGQGDYAELWELRQALANALESKRTSGFQLAKNNRAYKVAKASLILKLRSEGMPVTIINDVVAGDEDIADLAFARDCAQVTYDTDQEVINATKKNIGIVQDQINREWAAVPHTEY